MLGEGVSSVVEAVQDKQMGHQFTCKMIIMHEGLLKQLVHELTFLSGLRHTNMVCFYSMYMLPSNSKVKLIMELCEGKSLATVGEQIQWRKGHVGEKGTVKLCDFGISSKLIGSHAGTFMGTTKYMAVQIVAPQHTMGREYTICADVWSMGLEDEDSYRDM
ncbi:kinase-like domain-containing protein [Russula earlei]|uniref:Kinase-like domain-containing protein n=1 Tax=Russula earlei TaxID=71964 RepID=A0ACC0UFA4_9AGAM|nr:kinase-like domain-containing protein [Russula earlei]